MSTNRKRLLALSAIALAGFLTWWAGIDAPKKEVFIKRQLVEDIYTKEVLPWYDIYYKWNGRVQENPSWMIFKTSKSGAEWKVIDSKEIRSLDDPEELLKHSQKFDSKWINEYKFSAQPSRYQMILLLLTAQPLFSEEKDAFYEVLKEIEQLDKSGK